MSSRRHRIVHRTTMRYEGEVTAAHNELRMIPVSEPGQATLEARVRVKPLTWSHVYEDHWGTQVMAMESQTGHEVLEIEATSTVERSELPVQADAVGWAAVRDATTCDRLSEFLAQTGRTAPPEEVVALAQERVEDPTPRAAGLAIVERLRERLTYESGITGWQSTAADVWAGGKGVCQDFAHVTLGALRSAGIPARYVSGYLTAEDTDVQRGTTVPARNHAWIELWDGGWHALDPTNTGPVGLDHVVIGRGRDYDDVSPFRGIFVGPPVSDLDIEITYTRLG
ncbi:MULTISPECIES: transglutaminase family protein [Janibacter]|jgi:transglutaminase-like putative cysteine protease|uniref:transglutaminase family protein n=1 Tax=Janibacter TaxID=53457 RepID=UPI000829FD8B|nr:transglutaminase family protein [Janibacter terrae]MBA4084721.1 transglutaminase family protein [Kytococcus sp.]HBO54054.1 transglutaminase family protein [Janibacter terrae]